MTDMQVQPIAQDSVQKVDHVEVPQEMRAYLEAVLEEADLLILNEEEREQIIQNMYRQLDLFLLTRILENLPEEKLEAFEKLDEDKANITQIEDFIRSSVPNAKELFEKAYEDFRELYLDSLAIEEARIEAIAQDASSDSKSMLEKLAIGETIPTEQ
jgi:hypothetical protein